MQKNTNTFTIYILKFYSLCRKEGNPRETQIVSIDKDILYEHIWLATML